MKKTFVLDTNVILHDGSCIYNFEDNDLIVPISVLEEIDNFKKGNDIINRNARNFNRFLDEISGQDVFNGGMSIGSDKGKIKIQLEHKLQDEIKKNFPSHKRDHNILNTILANVKKYPNEYFVLVSKDVNLRMKAKSLGIKAQDYNADAVDDVNNLYKGFEVVENVPEDVIDSLFGHNNQIETVSPEMLNLAEDLYPNKFFILRNGNKSVLAKYKSGKIERVVKRKYCGIKPLNAEQIFTGDALTDPDIPLITLSGKAGTGKTLLALAASIAIKKNYRQIFLTRPTVPLSNKDPGCLPGDSKEKIDPYMTPLYDNLGFIQNETGNGISIKKMEEEEKIVIVPLSYIRGRSLFRVIFIIDEAQNLTPHEMKTIITRAGEGTKIIFTGDIFQIDHPYLDARSNGLSFVIEKMKGQKAYAHVNLSKGERSELANIATKVL